jgi:hypothetical protein
VVTPELLSTELRTVGHGSCYAISKMGSFLAPYLVVSQASYLFIGSLLALLQFVAAIAAHMLPETAGKSDSALCTLYSALCTLHSVLCTISVMLQVAGS